MIKALKFTVRFSLKKKTTKSKTPCFGTYTLIMEWNRVNEITQSFYFPVVFHHWGFPINGIPPMISFQPGSKWNIPPVKRYKSNLQHLDRYRSPKGSISPEYSPIQQEWNTPFIPSTLCAKTRQFPSPESFLMLQSQSYWDYMIKTTSQHICCEKSTIKNCYISIILPW